MKVSEYLKLKNWFKYKYPKYSLHLIQGYGLYCYPEENIIQIGLNLVRESTIWEIETGLYHELYHLQIQNGSTIKCLYQSIKWKYFPETLFKYLTRKEEILADYYMNSFFVCSLDFLILLRRIMLKFNSQLEYNEKNHTHPDFYTRALNLGISKETFDKLT